MCVHIRDMQNKFWVISSNVILIFVCLQGISREYRAVWMIHYSRVCLALYVIVWYIYPINLL